MFFHRRPKKEEKPVDPVLIQRLQRIRDLYMESAEIMGKTAKLTTFLSRYEDARRFIGDFNGIMVKTGQDQILEMYDDIEALFIGRLGAVVDNEIAGADALRTKTGRGDRLSRLIQELERFDRPDEGAIDDAIMKAEHKLFGLLDGTVDWSKESAEATAGLDEDMFVGMLKEAAVADAKKKGFSDDQIKEVMKKVFAK